MRIVTKINLALFGAVAVSALFNLAALNLTVLPSFTKLENESAQRNQARAFEALQQQATQVAASAGDYAFWDDTYRFAMGDFPNYIEQNVSAESLATLGLNYVAILDTGGRLIVASGFDFSGEEPVPVELPIPELMPGEVLQRISEDIEPRSGLARTPLGLAAVGYAPVLRSDRSGPPAGILVFARLLDIEDLGALTKVDFDIIPPGLEDERANNAQTLPLAQELTGLDGDSIGVLASYTAREISSAGRNTISAAVALLGVSTLLLVAVLSVTLRKIAVRRIEKLGQHLKAVAETGNLDGLPDDRVNDELGDTVRSFNRMAMQLADARESLRKQHYLHGAADQAAGMLHNVRNAMSPISSIAWDLAQEHNASGRRNLAKAIDQLSDGQLPHDRVAKLTQFVCLSAAQMMRERDQQANDLKSLATMLRSVEDILKHHQGTADAERPMEAVDLQECMKDAANLVARRANVEVSSRPGAPDQLTAPRTTIDQILANLVVNAAEAVEAAGQPKPRIVIGTAATQLDGKPAVELWVEDNGEGIEPDVLDRVFERGFSTRRQRSGGLGLHWCANQANALGGRLLVESKGKGQGATFRLVLPAGRSSLENAA